MVPTWWLQVRASLIHFRAKPTSWTLKPSQMKGENPLWPLQIVPKIRPWLNLGWSSNYVDLQLILMTRCRWWGRGKTSRWHPLHHSCCAPVLLGNVILLDGWSKELSKFIWRGLIPAPWAAGRTQTLTKQNGNFRICTCSVLNSGSNFKLYILGLCIIFTVHVFYERYFWKIFTVSHSHLQHHLVLFGNSTYFIYPNLRHSSFYCPPLYFFIRCFYTCLTLLFNLPTSPLVQIFYTL